MMEYETSDDEPELGSLNISNDYYYQPVIDRGKRPAFPIRQPHSVRLQIPQYGSKTIRHSLPAYDLWKAFFPTYVSEIKFRVFHRPKLRHYNNGPQAMTRYGLYREHPIKSLSRNIYRCHNQLKHRIIRAIESGLSREDIMSRFILISKAADLSAKTGELMLFEYCEEHPPVLSQVGMASNVKIYKYGSSRGPIPKRSIPSKLGDHASRAKIFNQCDPEKAGQKIGFEETVRNEQQAKRIYYNPMRPGSSFRVLENNLYRAPIFEHEIPSCDFLVVRTRNSYYIRQVKTIFTVGQTLPLAPVPPPTELQIQKFRCDLSNVYIHKLFKASATTPASIKLEALAKLFPDYDKSVLQRRIRQSGAVPVIINNEKLFAQGQSSYGKITISKLRSLVRPEVYCLNMSMLAARQRLRELNYSESMICPMKSVELETEVLAAPWNTSKAVIAAMTGRLYLDLERHLIDPSGISREGFSCVSMPKSILEEEQMKNLESRNQQTRQSNPPPPQKNPLRARIIQEKIKRLALYQREAQLISEIQGRSLSLDDSLSSCDDDEEDSENVSETDFNNQLDILSRMVLEGRTDTEVTHENEEAERRQMLMEFKVNGNGPTVNGNPNQPKQSDECDLNVLKGKVLYITRTYSYAGKQVHSSEIVRDKRIIALYVKKKGDSLLASAQASANGAKHLDPCNGKSNTGGTTVFNQARPRSASLGPTELCRTEGTKIRISKKVLEGMRPTRSLRRQSYGA